MMSSTMPSAKYSCSGSPLMFWNGNTAMEGLSGSASAATGGATAITDSRRTGRPLPDMNRSGDILQGLRSTIFERGIQSIPHIVMHSARNAHAARCGNLLQACRNVYAVTENVVTIDYDIAKVYANAKGDTALLRYVRAAFGHGDLYLDHATHSVNDARKFQQAGHPLSS